MAIPRLYITTDLAPDTALILEGKQAHYLVQVMRLKAGDKVALFNGRHGEFHSVILQTGKKNVILQVQEQTRAFDSCPDIWLVFAPIKSGRIDYLVEKATELGVSRLIPVKTERTIVSRLNLERLQAHVIEAAEQSERLDIPMVEDMQPLTQKLEQWEPGRPLFYGDETHHGSSPAVLMQGKTPPLAVLVGPEGGFSPKEHQLLQHYSFAHGLSLGRRILRADTAALASLTLLQLYCGDWYPYVTKDRTE